MKFNCFQEAVGEMKAEFHTSEELHAQTDTTPVVSAPPLPRVASGHCDIPHLSVELTHQLLAEAPPRYPRR